MNTMMVVNQTRPLQESLSVVFCESFLCKLRGLTFKKHLPKNHGLVLVEKRDGRISTAIHMLFVFMKLGIVWINSDGLVVDKCVAHPWISLLLPLTSAQYVLEINPDRIDEFELGDKVNFEEIN